MFDAFIIFAAWLAVLCALTASAYVLAEAPYASVRRVGGIWFLRWDTFRVSCCIARQSRPASVFRVGGIRFFAFGHVRVSYCRSRKYVGRDLGEPLFA